jgi:hypothetical protein
VKRILLTTALILAIGVTGFARKYVTGGMTYSALGDYKIETADESLTLKGKELETFVISYEKTGMEVTVAIEKTRKCVNFYVLSPALSVKYVCNGKYFGVSKLGEELSADGYNTSETALNRGEYFHQKVLCCGQNSVLDNSRLIAAYFPMLLNSPENLAAR